MQTEATVVLDSDITINETNFADKNFTNWIIIHVKGVDNGVITPEECAAVTKMKVTLCSIKELAGIEYLPHLESLNCGFNKLTSLNVSGAIALQELDCKNNRIVGLNLSDITTLRKLFCQDNPAAYVNLHNGYRDRFEISSPTIASALSSLNLTEVFPDIKVEDITNLQGATLQGETLIDWSYNTPITYNYDCGQGVNLPLVLEISPASSMSIVSAASSTGFKETEQPKAEICTEQTAEVTANIVFEQAAQLAEESVPRSAGVVR